MKGFYKFFGLVAGLCFAFGIAFSIAGGIAGASPWQAIQDGALSFYINEHGIHTGTDHGIHTDATEVAIAETEILGVSYEADHKSEVKNLEVDLDAVNINFYTHDDSEEIRIEYHQLGNSVSALKGNTLTISHQGLDDGISLTDFGSDIYVDVYVPEGWIFDNVNIDINAGTIYIDDILVENNFEVNVDAGGLECYSYQAGNLIVEVDAGSANFYEGHCANSADLDCTAGSITLMLDEVYSVYDYEISTNVGMITVNGNTYGGLNTKQDISYGASKKIRANVDAGNIDIYTVE